MRPPNPKFLTLPILFLLASLFNSCDPGFRDISACDIAKEIVGGEKSIQVGKGAWFKITVKNQGNEPARGKLFDAISEGLFRYGQKMKINGKEVPVSFNKGNEFGPYDYCEIPLEIPAGGKTVIEIYVLAKTVPTAFTNNIFTFLPGKGEKWEKGDEAVRFSSAIINRIKVIPGPVTINDHCGQFRWPVRFELLDKSEKGGYIIQEVTMLRTLTKICGPVSGDCSKHKVPYTYYEAWKIEPGKKKPANRVENSPNDIFSGVACPQTNGTVEIKGKLVFFEGMDSLPPDFKTNNVPEAKNQPATRTRPGFWDASYASPHEISLSWKCCCEPGEQMQHGYNLKTIPQAP